MPRFRGDNHINDGYTVCVGHAPSVRHSSYLIDMFLESLLVIGPADIWEKLFFRGTGTIKEPRGAKTLAHSDPCACEPI